MKSCRRAQAIGASPLSTKEVPILMGKNKASKADVQSTKLNSFAANQDTEFAQDLTADAKAAFGSVNKKKKK